ncbi:MAG: glycosyltransferase family 2 protein [Candidatus Omnitrophica bacterium]|nr:glycosyltransferase family 2 protein [Candidatus Omnitrophota bacterium]
MTPDKVISNVDFSIIVPLYNEEEGVSATVNSLIDLRSKHSLKCEIILVNDGSTDKTSEIIKEFATVPNFKILRNTVNLGYGYSLKRGILIAESDIICIIDADGSYPIESIPELIFNMKDYDMVVGARQGEHYWGSIFKNPSRKLFLAMIHYITGVKVPDGNSGLRAFRKSKIMEFINLIGNKFSFTTSLTLASHYSNLAIKYIPVEYYKRKGKTKIRHIRDSIGAIQLMLQVSVYFDPFKVVFPITVLFGSIGFLFIVSYFFNQNHFLVLLGFLNIFFSISVLFFGLWAWLFVTSQKNKLDYAKKN